MSDTLDQDVRALKEWLRSAWRYLAQPTITRFEQRELRNYMKEADVALRAGLQKLAARDQLRVKNSYAAPADAEQAQARRTN